MDPPHVCVQSVESNKAGADCTLGYLLRGYGTVRQLAPDRRYTARKLGHARRERSGMSLTHMFLQPALAHGLIAYFADDRRPFR